MGFNDKGQQGRQGQTVGSNQGQATKPQGMPPAIQSYVELGANNMSTPANRLGWTLTSNMVERSITNFFTDKGIDVKEEGIIVRALFNKPFLNSMKRDSNKPIEPFFVHVFVMLDKETQRDARKGGSNFKGRGSVFSQLRSMANNRDSRQLDLITNPMISEVAGAFSRKDSIKWTLTKDSRCAKTVLDTDLVIRYLFAIPDSGRKYTLDFATAKETKNRGFVIETFKSVANKDFNRADFDPLKYVR